MGRQDVTNPSPRNFPIETAPRLYVVTPDLPANEAIDSINAVIDNVANAVDVVVQVRHKSLPDDKLTELARRVTQTCRSAGRRCVINDRVDIAQAVGADGVHLGQDDMATSEARQRFAGILGKTCRTINQAKAAEADGADYLGVGPTFISSSKTGLPEPLGVAGVTAIADSVKIPVYAIGGITTESAALLAPTRVHGAAVIAAIFDQPELAVDQAQRLTEALSANLEQTVDGR